MKNHNYTFSVLRYVHDVSTEEFINVGVALYSPDAKFLDAICINRYGRLSKMFHGVDGEHFKRVVAFIESRFKEKGKILGSEFQFEKHKTISKILTSVLPEDDSTLQFGKEGSGITDNPAKTLQQLYAKYCEKYLEKPEHRRNEEEIWKIFKKPLEERGVIQNLQTIKIESNVDEIEFKHAWKNGAWHVLQPVSFDLVMPQSIKDKATLWLGRGQTVLNKETVKEQFKDGLKMCFLIGAPSDKGLEKYFMAAKTILSQMPIENELVMEADAEKLAKIIEKDIRHHNPIRNEQQKK